MVATPLQVSGMPLVRFRTGDIATLHAAPCACGRTSPRLGPVLGRKSQMLKVKGTTVYPPAIFAVLQEIPAVRGYYVEVRDTFELSDRVTVTVGAAGRRADPGGGGRPDRGAHPRQAGGRHRDPGSRSSRAPSAPTSENPSPFSICGRSDMSTEPDRPWGSNFTPEEIAETRARKGLLSMELELSRECNLRCVYCYASSGKALHNELTREEIDDALDQAIALGARRIIVIGGGEPLLYPGVMDIMRGLRGARHHGRPVHERDADHPRGRPGALRDGHLRRRQAQQHARGGPGRARGGPRHLPA